MILAQVPTTPWPVMGSWMVGLIGVLGVFYLLLSLVKTALDLFGRKQSVESIVTEREQLLRLEIQNLHARLTSHRQSMDERFTSLAIERQRNLEALHEKINTVRDSVQFMRGKMERGELK